MGSLLALTAIGASIALILLPVGSIYVFGTLALALLSLGCSAFLRTRPGLLTTAGLLNWLALIIAAPFSITIQQKRLLERRARQDDELATHVLGVYEAFEPYSATLMVVVTLMIAGIVFFAIWRDSKGPWSALLRESDGIAAILTYIGIAGALLYAPLIIIIVYDVFQRQYLEISPQFTNTAWYRVFTSTRIQEMQWHLHAILFLVCLAYGYVKNAHVRIELVREGFTMRRRAWIELAGCLLFLIPYCYVVMNYGIENALRSFNIMEASASQTGLPFRFVIKGFLPLGFALLALAGLSVAMRCLVYLFGAASLRPSADSHLGVDPAATLDPLKT